MSTNSLAPHQIEAFEMVASLDPLIDKLVDEHEERREHWYFQDFVPWEQGRSFVTEPWQESDANLSPEVRLSLVLNLLTEDNLPYYHSLFMPFYGKDSAMQRWSGIWTAEEGQHAIAMRSYLLTSRNCNPVLLEDDRMVTMQGGFIGNFRNCLDIFCYTSAQELATRISHRNAGRLADDPVAFELMRRVAKDENYHYLFYRNVAKALFEISPDVMVKSFNYTLENFEMPGTTIPSFGRRAIQMAKIGIYNSRIHCENIVEPLLRFFEIESLEGLSAEGEQARESLLSMPKRLIEHAEKFEARVAKQEARRARKAAEFAAENGTADADASDFAAGGAGGAQSGGTESGGNGQGLSEDLISRAKLVAASRAN